MKRARILILVAISATIWTGCRERADTAAFDIATAREVIEEKNRQFTKAHVTGQVEIINAYFSEDAKIFLPNSEVVTGSANIANLNSEYVGYGISAFREETTALYGSGDFLIEEGKYSMTYGADNTVENGKYINIWKQENGDWKVYSNIWNSSMPATPE